MLSNGESYLPFVLILGAPTLFFLFRFLQQLVWLFRPSLHPAFRRMLPHANRDTIYLLAEKEYRRSIFLGQPDRTEDYRLSPRFVFARSPGQFAVIPVDDLIWVTFRRSRIENDEGPPTVNHDVVLVDYKKKKTLLHFKDPVEAKDCIALIRAQCPWLIFSRSPHTRRYVRKHANTLHRQTIRRRMDYQEALAAQEATMEHSKEISDNQKAI